MQSDRDLFKEMLHKKTGKIPNEGEKTIDAGRFSEFMSQQSTIKLAITFYSNSGNYHYYNQRYDEAMTAFENVLVLDPKNYQAQNSLGLIHVARKNYANAEAIFTDSINLYPNTTAYYNRALINLQQRNYEAAIYDCKQAINLDPKHIRSYKLLAKTYSILKQWDLAIAAYKNCIALKPNHFLFRDCGKAHEHLGMITEAITYYVQALTLNPKSETTHMDLNGLLCSINNDHDLSMLDKVTLFDALTKLRPNKQLPFLELCKDETSPFGIIMHKPRGSYANVITFFNGNPNNWEFAKCDKNKGMLKKIDEQISAIKQKLHIPDSSDSQEEYWSDENSEEEMHLLKKQKI